MCAETRVHVRLEYWPGNGKGGIGIRGCCSARPPTLAPAGKQQGLTLVEVIISMTIGLLIVLASTALLMASRGGYTAGDESGRLDDAGRFALDNIARSVRQAGAASWSADRPPLRATDDMTPDILGYDSRSLTTTSLAIDTPLAKAINGSDILAVRFFGSGQGENGDGIALNCAGFSKGSPDTQADAENDRAWSIYYVAEDATGEPELYCKYNSKSGWNAQAIVRGVESFQVLYGLDMDDDGAPEQYVNATTLRAMDAALPVSVATAADSSAERNRQSRWKKIVAVKVSLLLRGSAPARMDRPAVEYHLFGKDYAASGTDAGTTVREESIPIKSRNRLRRQFGATFQLRNRSAGSAA
jgi:type IV pilus assembly protein PilW